MPHLSPLIWYSPSLMLWLALLMIVIIISWQQTLNFPHTPEIS